MTKDGTMLDEEQEKQDTYSNGGHFMPRATSIQSNENSLLKPNPDLPTWTTLQFIESDSEDSPNPLQSTPVVENSDSQVGKSARAVRTHQSTTQDLSLSANTTDETQVARQLHANSSTGPRTTRRPSNLGTQLDHGDSPESGVDLKLNMDQSTGSPLVVDSRPERAMRNKFLGVVINSKSVNIHGSRGKTLLRTHDAAPNSLQNGVRDLVDSVSSGSYIPKKDNGVSDTRSLDASSSKTSAISRSKPKQVMSKLNPRPANNKAKLKETSRRAAPSSIPYYFSKSKSTKDTSNFGNTTSKRDDVNGVGAAGLAQALNEAAQSFVLIPTVKRSSAFRGDQSKINEITKTSKSKHNMRLSSPPHSPLSSQTISFPSIKNAEDGNSLADTLQMAFSRNAYIPSPSPLPSPPTPIPTPTPAPAPAPPAFVAQITELPSVNYRNQLQSPGRITKGLVSKSAPIVILDEEELEDLTDADIALVGFETKAGSPTLPSVNAGEQQLIINNIRTTNHQTQTVNDADEKKFGDAQPSQIFFERTRDDLYIELLESTFGPGDIFRGEKKPKFAQNLSDVLSQDTSTPSSRAGSPQSSDNDPLAEPLLESEDELGLTAASRPPTETIVIPRVNPLRAPLYLTKSLLGKRSRRQPSAQDDEMLIQAKPTARKVHSTDRISVERRYPTSPQVPDSPEGGDIASTESTANKKLINPTNYINTISSEISPVNNKSWARSLLAFAKGKQASQTAVDELPNLLMILNRIRITPSQVPKDSPLAQSVQRLAKLSEEEYPPSPEGKILHLLVREVAALLEATAGGIEDNDMDVDVDVL